MEKSLCHLLNSNGDFALLLQKKFGLGKINSIEEKLNSILKSQPNVYQLLTERFKSLKQNVKIEEFSKSDESGSVFGWSSKIVLKLAKVGTSNHVVDGKGYVSLNDLSLFIKKFQFYSQNNSTFDAKKTVVAHSVEEGVESKCNECGITLWIVNQN